MARTKSISLLNHLWLITKTVGIPMIGVTFGLLLVMLVCSADANAKSVIKPIVSVGSSLVGALTGGVGLITGIASAASAFGGNKKQKKLDQIQFQNQMAAAEQQKQATAKQMAALKQAQQQQQVGRQMKRRITSGEQTQTILTPLGVASSQGGKSTLG